MKTENIYFAELTDTFADDANYSWVKRFNIRANTMRGAINKLSRETGYSFKIECTGEVTRYNVKNACICVFIEDDTDSEQSKYYTNIKLI